MEKYVVYKNRFNEVKPYWIRVDGENEQELSVFDLTVKKRKTFKISQVLHESSNMEEAENAAQMEQSKVKIIPRGTGTKRPVNHLNKLEVCFTGFASSDKKEMELRAVDNEMFVRSSVTKNLGLLVCGDNAGPAKIKKAMSNNISCIYGIEGFEMFIETGLVSE